MHIKYHAVIKAKKLVVKLFPRKHCSPPINPHRVVKWGSPEKNWSPNTGKGKCPTIPKKTLLPTDQSLQSGEMEKPGEEIVTQHRTGDGKKCPALPLQHNLSKL